MKKLLLLTVLLCCLSCKAQDCENLPKSFNSYSEAVAKIANASFNFSDSVDTSRSSWIKEADFYSCDGVNGFLILKTSKNNYVFKNVPLNVWTNFKEASSFGEFYNTYLRGKFQLAI